MPKLDLKNHIRTVPDFPEAGIMYRDITTLLSHPGALKQSIEELAEAYREAKIDVVAGIDARGFIFGTAVALELGVGFVPVRKKGKLPFKTYEQDYQLEYGTDTLQIHADAVTNATGGTAEAAIKLLQHTDCAIVGAAFVIDLPDLGGAKKIEALGVPVASLIAFLGH